MGPAAAHRSGDADVRNAVALLLAGGVGSRLNVFVRRRAKPAVPFAGIYRIIDFTLSNLMNSGIERVGILTQYLPYSLSEHVARGEAWGLSGRRRETRILPPHTGTSQADWYRGTADAVYRNLSYVRRHNPDLILVVSGDHVYSMDYASMIEHHLDSGAAATIAVQTFPLEECTSFGTVFVDDGMRILGFEEKPAKPKSPLVSLGIYVFNREILERSLEDAVGTRGGTDFGRHIFPEMLGRGDRLVAYPFEGYWQDVGTLEAYFETHQQILRGDPRLDLSQWGVRTNLEEERTSDRSPALLSSSAEVEGSLVCRGCRVEGRVASSVLSPGVVVEEGAEVRESILFHDVHVGAGARLHKVIVDKDAVIRPRALLGIDLGDGRPNATYPHHLDSGLTVVGKKAVVGAGARVGRNCCIGPGMDLDRIGVREMADGETADEDGA